jgi:ABC-type transport system involved in multi-copper enzyme maturation permease subunit
MNGIALGMYYDDSSTVCCEIIFIITIRGILSVSSVKLNNAVHDDNNTSFVSILSYIRPYAFNLRLLGLQKLFSQF